MLVNEVMKIFLILSYVVYTRIGVHHIFIFDGSLGRCNAVRGRSLLASENIRRRFGRTGRHAGLGHQWTWFFDRDRGHGCGARRCKVTT